MIDEIRGRSYSDWLGNIDLAAVYADRKHLLKMVDALATGAAEDSCPYAYHDRQGEKCDRCKIEGATLEEAKQIEACWVAWADVQAMGEGARRGDDGR